MKVEQLHGPKEKSSQVAALVNIFQSRHPCLLENHCLHEEGKIIVTRAPARLDIMGGIADYCGSNVFEMTLNRETVAACQARKDNNLIAYTFHPDVYIGTHFQISLDDFYSDQKLISYKQVRELFNRFPTTTWTGYALGCFFTLLKEKKIETFPHGAILIIKSDIPIGAGIASSAAIEVACMTAILHLYNIKLPKMEIARLAQIVENRVVGAPCGIMDQVTATVGRKNKILSILCQPSKILEYVDIPASVSIIGIHTKVYRSTNSTEYIDSRTAAFMGLTILKKELEWEKLNDNYLCNVSTDEFIESCAPILPHIIKGDDFLEKYGDSVDTVTKVEPKKIYYVKNCVQHPIYENERVKKFIVALKNVIQNPDNAHVHLKEAGKLMYESNASYRDLVGLGSSHVDGIVNIAKKIGEKGGIYGAKITGGGGGGTVAVLLYGEISTSLAQIAAAYKLSWGRDIEIFTDSSHGAVEFGHYEWELKESEPMTHF